MKEVTAKRRLIRKCLEFLLIMFAGKPFLRELNRKRKEKKERGESRNRSVLNNVRKKFFERIKAKRKREKREG
jgi:hypothetical protein